MLIQNAIKITEKNRKPIYLKSCFRHDFRVHVFKDGSCVAVDGGLDYARRVGTVPAGIKMTDFSLDYKSHPLRVRNRLLWGTLGKNGKGKHKFVRLCDCSKAHLVAILQLNISPLYRDVIEHLLASRIKAKKIRI